ncbi:retropepsin-like aspartic protease [Winogradskyella maritima]|uniref:Retropepsin-like aspartic protease n=1 Tax=Winogradskyella maritima TaxID=1517766 RepID=A0ABV8AHM1_9FLAO|nr:retropepsin-like aspartic protease [Winogradskyella maritima]
MTLLKDFLTERGYKRRKLKLTKTNHFEVTATLNGIKGRFILDTGASNSCLGFEMAEQFLLKAEASDIKAVGAGASDLMTKVAEGNTVTIGKWKTEDVSLVLFNLDHVNEGLILHGSNRVDGILGADILRLGNAIIDYEKKYLYLK